MLQHRAIKSRASKRRNHTAAGILFALPWIIGFLAFSLYPIIMSVYYSLTDFNMFQTPKFVGLENYSALFQDEKFYKSLGNTLYMTVLGTPLCLVAGLLLAVLLNQKVRAMPIFRTFFYLPSIVPLVASSMLWPVSYTHLGTMSSIDGLCSGGAWCCSCGRHALRQAAVFFCIY